MLKEAALSPRGHGSFQFQINCKVTINNILILKNDAYTSATYSGTMKNELSHLLTGSQIIAAKKKRSYLEEAESNKKYL